MPAFTASNLDTFLSLTIEHQIRSVITQTLDTNVLLWWLKRKGRFKTLNPPGESIRIPARYTTTSKAKWYTGMEQLNLQEEEVAKTLSYEWKFFAVPIVLDNTKLRRNTGSAALASYLETVVEAAHEEAETELELRLITKPNGADASKQMNGILSFLATDGRITHGGHTSTGSDWWANKYVDATNDVIDGGGTFSFASHGWGLWQYAYLHAAGSSRATETPDLIVCDKNQWFWMSRLVKAMYAIELTNKALVDIGVENFRFNNATAIWSPNMTTGYAAFLNTKYIYVWTDGEIKMDPWQDFRPKQDGRATALRVMIQLGCVKPSAQCLAFGADSA